MNRVATALAVCRKELSVWFGGGLGWVVLAGFAMLASLLFSVSVDETGEASLRGLLSPLAVLLLFFVPLITMRQLAEEERLATLELLMTAPLPLSSLVLGKFAAAMALCTALLAMLAPIVFALFLYAQPDPALVAMALAGWWLACALYASVGLFVSSLTRDTSLAGVGSVLVLLPCWLASAGTEQLPASWRPVLERVSVTEHLASFGRGLLDLGDWTWFASLTGLFLFLTWQSLETRRWR